MKKYLVISSHDDAHIPFVQAHLSTELLIISPKSLLQKDTDLAFSFDHISGRSSIRYAGALLDTVQSVWYRKPDPYDDDMIPQVDKAFKSYALDSLLEHFAALRTSCADSLWVSDYFKLWRAEQKPLQYKTAQAVGLHVPDTLITNSEPSARQFIAGHDAVVVKHLGHETPNGTYFPTTIASTDLDLNNLYLAPSIFQQAVQPIIELRITVVGQEVFTAGIQDTYGIRERPDIRDWKLSQLKDKKLKFQPYDNLPDKIRQSCLDLVKRLGLQFGAIDMIVDKHDNYWFLEINPNGQWAFIEEDTGLAIGKSMAALLSGKAPSL